VGAVSVFVSQNFLGRCQENEFHAFVFRRLNFHRICRHFLTRSSIHQVDFFRTVAKEISRTVDGGVSTADDHGRFSDGKLFAAASRERKSVPV
jgi:hypothetical protein